VVTGGGGGIGGAIAVRLVEPGARVVVAAATKAVTSAGAVLTPEAVAELVLEAVDDERFLILPHPEVLEMYRRKGADYEKWLSGMRRYQAGLLAAR
jgi:NAD(P)-dependent dehydrogenase (short-subunit alcohol dehydrogenase family)